MTNFVTAMVVQDCPNHFVMEWDGGPVPTGAKVGPHTIMALRGNMLESPKDKTAKLLGLFVEMPSGEGDAVGHRRILIGTDFGHAFNPDGSPCVKAPAAMVEMLSKITGVSEADAKSRRRKNRRKIARLAQE